MCTHTDRHFRSCFVSFSYIFIFVNIYTNTYSFIYFKMCLYLFPKLLFYFPIVWFVPFSKQIFKLFSSLLFEQNANIEINVKCVYVCGVFRATCKVIQLKAIAKRERTFWFFLKILTWNWNIWFCMVCLLSLFLFLLLLLLLFCVLPSLLSFSIRKSLSCCIEDVDDGKFSECGCTVHNSKCLFKW